MVEITSTHVIKTFKHRNARMKVEHLETIYKLINDHSIPNTDRLVHVKDSTIYLQPRGIASHPGVVEELRQCLKCILEALVVRIDISLIFETSAHLVLVAHQIPLYHRDIRWENIIRRIEDESKWFLIDWEDAAMPPTSAAAQPFFTKETHSPAIFHDEHGPEVDIWAIGYLIRTSKALWRSVEMIRVGERICEESRELSAQEVLVLLANSH